MCKHFAEGNNFIICLDCKFLSIDIGNWVVQFSWSQGLKLSLFQRFKLKKEIKL